MPIPEITREHVLRALAELDGGVDHFFHEPTKYELLHEGRRYAPKAVVGIAAKYATGRILHYSEFSGGEGAGQANDVLRRLGFEIVPKVEDVDAVGEDWSPHEVRLVVADYFDMLGAELMGQEYSKTDHRRRLTPQLQGRSDGSVEFKHQNISGVLVHMGSPYINGYKPRGNYQSLLADGVESYLLEHPTFFDKVANERILNPASPPDMRRVPVSQLIESPPERIVVPEETSQPWLSRRGRKIDFVRRDAENRCLGRLGEEFVLDLERRRLLEAGRDDLASRIEWTAQTRGDGIGFDILSYSEDDESERLVEVKATGLGKFFPFYVSALEVRCSEATATQYHLYRVFDFASSPRLYVLRGALSTVCHLDPVQYRAAI